MRLKFVGPSDMRGDTQEERNLMARVGAILFASGGALGLIWLVLPHSPTANELGGLINSLGAFAAAAIVFTIGGRLPRALIPAIATLGTLAVTVSVFMSGDKQSGYIMLYLWVVVYSFYCFSIREAILQLVLVAVCYTYTAVTYQTPNGAVSRWVLVVGTLTIAGMLIRGLKQRLDTLVDSLEDAARTDPLTGLLNRRGFEEAFGLEVERARRGDRTLSLVVGDLDRFKQVNDRLGHHAGDNGLKRASDILTDAKRRIDCAARLGGEEFALVLPDADHHDAQAVAERVRRMLRDEFADQPVPITISFGIASFPSHGGSTEALLHAADQALYVAKARGRDCSVIHGTHPDRPLTGLPIMNGHRDDHAAMLVTLASAVDLRHAGVPGHSQAVGRLAELVALELGMDRNDVELLYLAGVLHDVGKVAVPAAVLQHPGPLTVEQLREVQKHPDIGARIVANAGLDDIARWVRAHHERPDGCGYPRGLAADRIPAEAKILAAADAYEAMTGVRLYRSPLDAEAAEEELARCAGSQFDEQVVEALVQVTRRQAIEARSNAAA